jgi:hypothetical protein
MEKNLLEAAQLYISRQSRKANPVGQFDKAGRWYPAESETCPCCGRIRSPSRAWPYSRMLHCRTAVHIANLFDVPAVEIRRAARALSGEG